MIVKVPITGEIIKYDPEHPELSSGNPQNPVRPIDFTKLLPDTNFAWKAVDFDYVNGFMTIEITFAKLTAVTEWDNTKTPHEALAWRTESDTEFYTRQANTEQALKDTFEKKTADELYEITKEARVRKPQVVS